MARLSNDKLISNISIPGTHDTMARKGGPAAWCQSLSLTDQMIMGIRFLDIRCRYYGTGLPIHHGRFYQGFTFSKVLNDATEFLSRNPSEIILMRVKQEYSNEKIALFEKRVKDYISRYSQRRFWLNETIPSVADARGRIVLLRDFGTDALPYGIPYSHLIISDDYKALLKKKSNEVKWNIGKAQNGISNDMYLTFNSDSIIAPRDAAKTLNKWLYNYVWAKKGRLGIIAIDYPGPGLVQRIIDSNF